LDVFSAEGKMAGSYSQDEMQTWLKKHGVEVSFEGHKIVPKAIDLQQVNMGQFSNSSQFSSIITMVSNEIKNESGSIDFELLLGTGATGTPLPGLVADLGKKVEKLQLDLGSLALDETARFGRLVDTETLKA
jgi:hypothetical protein